MKKKIIGITGGSGSGKSTLASLFAADGFYIIDCDALVHDLYETDEYRKTVLSAFPTAGENGKINRKKLAQAVFSDPVKLQRLNDAVLPMIRKAVLSLAENARGYRGVVLDAPTLFEAGLEKECDAVVGVTANKELRTKRIQMRDGISCEAARARIDSQKSDDFYIANCDFTVSGNDSGELKRECADILKKIGA